MIWTGQRHLIPVLRWLLCDHAKLRLEIIQGLPERAKNRRYNKGKRFSSVEQLLTTLAAESLDLGVEPDTRSSYFPLDWRARAYPAWSPVPTAAAPSLSPPDPCLLLPNVLSQADDCLSIRYKRLGGTGSYDDRIMWWDCSSSLDLTVLASVILLVSLCCSLWPQGESPCVCKWGCSQIPHPFPDPWSSGLGCCFLPSNLAHKSQMLGFSSSTGALASLVFLLPSPGHTFVFSQPPKGPVRSLIPASYPETEFFDSASGSTRKDRKVVTSWMM